MTDVMIDVYRLAAEDRKRADKLTAYVRRLSYRTGLYWMLERTYETVHGNYSAELVSGSGKRMLVRYSQDRWKKHD